MTEFKPVQILKPVLYNRPQQCEYWKSMSVPVYHQMSGTIEFIDANEVVNRILVSSGSRIQLIDCDTFESVRTFDKVPEKAYQCRFRQDGQLFCAGYADKVVRLYRTSGTESCLREFSDQHTAAVHACNFTSEGIITCCDNGNVCIFDIVDGRCIGKLYEYEDHVRAVSNEIDFLVFTGSYDHTSALLDIRQNAAKVLTVNHEAPVQSVLYMSPSICVTTGAAEVRLWDIRTGGRLLHTFTNHHKTVLSLAVSDRNSYLLAAGLDKHIQVYDLQQFEHVHSFDYHSPITAISLSRQDGILVTGMSDGAVLFSKRRITNKEKPKKELKEDVIRTKLKPKRRLFEKLLKGYNASDAFDEALKGRPPYETVSIFQELIRREEMRTALVGRTSEEYFKVISFIRKHLSNPNYTEILLNTLIIITELWFTGLNGPLNSDVQKPLNALNCVLTEEIAFQRELLKIVGAAETLCQSL